ncbi:mandelate racemase/muconate lactonizing enzyme family protein [Sphingomonas hengshuiensis]|uniref:Enolase n=1 Tax=Sphingomonas hengshuiensis TaxID=1609977 RepID=A0A7U4LEE7_9SPHN|nr:mandelate racemase/muconate lactonizing enzyme family protein [Sphingomonas hengshuiensis]AJP71128.1 enolase [Sphingomonas hengshuiensis]
MRIAAIDTFIVTVPRETPYLGPLAKGERVNARGYIVRTGNGTLYPTTDRSIAVRVTAEDGSVGWGETYGLCAPRATCEIVNDLLAPVLIGEAVTDIGATWDLLYGLMRVRGAWSGFHVDAIAAIDIALWDLKGKAEGKPVRDLIGETAHAIIPSYLSGLPAATLAARVALAKEWQARGIDAFKFAAVVSHEGIVAEMAALRDALGDATEILIDLHWKFSPAEAAELIAALAPYRPGFVEAPVKPEDVAGLAHLAATSPVPVAAGEEWYTEYEAINRLAAGPLAYIQPEMGHTGITQFLRIARLAALKHVAVAPHATIGTGIFLAASLQASATLPGLWKHEWQHSVFERNLALLDTDMAHGEGGYVLPSAPGLGVAPNARFWDHAELVT